MANSIYGSDHLFYYSENRECDFVILREKDFKAVIQVCFELNHGNYKRETEGLIQAMEFAGLKEGYLLTFDQEDRIIKDDLKIVIKPVWQWLLD